MPKKKKTRKKKASPKQKPQSPRSTSNLLHRPASVVLLDYYQRPFRRFYQELVRTHRLQDSIHPIRESYWSKVKPHRYSLLEARRLLLDYCDFVADELERLLSKWSISYWLHAYRRLFPGPIGPDQQPMTIGLTRAVFEAAIQKYGTALLCQRVAFGHEIRIAEVLNGLLLDPEFALEREIVETTPRQLLLTNFGPTELLELYTAEKLAFEVWRVGATLRCVGKGAPFVVEDSYPFYRDDRDDELDWLIRRYDNSHETQTASTAAVVFKDGLRSSASGVVTMPTYNLGGVTGKEVAPLFEQLTGVALQIASDTALNFMWLPFELRSYRSAHSPFSVAFRTHYGTSLDAVLLVVAALCERVFLTWCQEDATTMLRYWQRAYEGPYDWSMIVKEVQAYRNHGAERLGIDDDRILPDDFKRALEFWTLTQQKRSEIDLLYSGRHYIFLPCGTDRFFIDYAWIHRRLRDLFVGISIPDQNFKGDALEERTRVKPSELPVGECKAEDGSSKQIDAAFIVGKHLVIVECKAVARSIGFDRGDPEAIEYRRKQVVERVLSEVDDKARWLAGHPIGTNYRVDQLQDILPVGVSPFVEFIPSRSPRYWIDASTPRVLTPEALERLLSSANSVGQSWNRVDINSSA